MYGAVVGAAMFQLLVWLVPNVVGDAVAVAVVGLLLGPVYSCAMVVFTRAVPMRDQVNGLSFISALGSSGGYVISSSFVAVIVTDVLQSRGSVYYGYLGTGWGHLHSASYRD